MSPAAISVERWTAADIVLLDIEGTISSISFVKDTLYPYALRRLTRLAHESWDDADFQELIAGFPEETRKSADTLVTHVEELTSKDIKAVYLKQLQGKLWKQGYSTGELTTPLYPDVLPTLESWLALPKSLAIFSSGSLEAQQNFFKHIQLPSSPPPKTRDLNPLFLAKFDTVTAGPKLEPVSYRKICEELGTVPEKVVFLTDNVKEAAAAAEARVYAVVVDRPGNAPLAPEIYELYPVITALDQIALA